WRNAVQSDLVQQAQARTGERKRRIDSADAVALGSTHVQQIVVVQLKVHTELRILDRLTLLPVGETRPAGERARLKNAVLVRIPRDAGGGRDAPLFGDLVGSLPVDRVLFIDGAFVADIGQVAGKQHGSGHQGGQIGADFRVVVALARVDELEAEGPLQWLIGCARLNPEV